MNQRAKFSGWPSSNPIDLMHSAQVANSAVEPTSSRLQNPSSKTTFNSEEPKPRLIEESPEWENSQLEDEVRTTYFNHLTKPSPSPQLPEPSSRRSCINELSPNPARRNEMEASRNRIRFLESEFAQFKALFEEQAAELERTRKERQAIKQQLKAELSRGGNLREEIDSLKSENSHLNSTNISLQDEVDGLQQKLRGLELQISRMNSERQTTQRLVPQTATKNVGETMNSQVRVQNPGIPNKAMTNVTNQPQLKLSQENQSVLGSSQLSSPLFYKLDPSTNKLVEISNLGSQAQLMERARTQNNTPQGNYNSQMASIQDAMLSRCQNSVVQEAAKKPVVNYSSSNPNPHYVLAKEPLKLANVAGRGEVKQNSSLLLH